MESLNNAQSRPRRRRVQRRSCGSTGGVASGINGRNEEYVAMAVAESDTLSWEAPRIQPPFMADTRTHLRCFFTGPGSLPKASGRFSGRAEMAELWHPESWYIQA